jgi:hypothetical protein
VISGSETTCCSRGYLRLVGRMPPVRRSQAGQLPPLQRRRLGAYTEAKTGVLLDILERAED